MGMRPMSSQPLLPVLADEVVWPEFVPAIASLGPAWRSSAGRSYRVELDGQRVVVSLQLSGPDLPDGDEIDHDLLELAGAIQDAVGPPWGSEELRRAAIAYGWYGRPFATE